MMRTQATLFLLCTIGLLAMSPADARAQAGSISGLVQEEATGNPIPAATVRVTGDDGRPLRNVTTSATGGFRVSDVAPGTYTVRVEALGYAPAVVLDVRVTAGDDARVTVLLAWRAFELNPLVVTASLVEEESLEAVAAVEVVSRADITERPAFTLADHLKDVAGVDVIRTGLQGNYVTVRGFNNIFSGATLTLTDYRVASVPSLRANIHHMNPTTSADVERIEVVLGPGSALYGPNAANGVIHTITRSPIDFPGGSFSVATGVRQQRAVADTVPPGGDVVNIPSGNEAVAHAEGRYSVRMSEQFGVKLSGQYFGGEEWEFTDLVEAQQRALADQCRGQSYQVNAPACQNFAEGLNFQNPDHVELLRTSVDNVAAGRDNGIRRYSLDLRADWRPTEDVGLIFSGGRSTNNRSVDLTGLGAAQVIDWNSNYLQTRASFREAFAQVFFNKSDNTESYLLRSGRPLVDRSSLLVAQLRNTSVVGDRHRFVYGVDMLRTNPQTEGTINGQNEDDDDITEFGAYGQTEMRLSDRFDLLTALRVDTHTRLEDPVLSPRAALVYRPVPGQNLRFTYNRAFSTPTTLNLFLDISGGTIPLGGPFRYDVRAQGTTEHGMQFSRTNGIPDYMSPFGLLLGHGTRELRPTTTENLWATAVAVVNAQDPQTGAFLQSLPVPTGEQVGIDLRLVNLDAGEAESPFQTAPYTLAALGDIERLRPTITNTLELGYKGLVAERLLLSANAYHTRIDDFTSALRVNSPNVFLNPNDVRAYLEGFGVPPENAQALARSIGGDGTRAAPGIPLGVITPIQAGGTDAAVVLTYENLGDVSFWGADLSATLLIEPFWEITANAAWVSDDRFQAGDEIVPLNAPTRKGGASVRYRNPHTGVNGQVRLRHVGSFPANSAVYVGEVDAYTVFDLNLGYRLPWFAGVTAQLDVQNLFDTEYRTFVGTPLLGRLALLRLRYDF